MEEIENHYRTELLDIVENVTKRYSFSYNEITKFYDTSRTNDNKRFVFVLDNKFVLIITEEALINEEFLVEINNLSKRYNDTGTETPKLIKTTLGNFSTTINFHGKNLVSYL